MEVTVLTQWPKTFVYGAHKSSGGSSSQLAKLQLWRGCVRALIRRVTRLLLRFPHKDQSLELCSDMDKLHLDCLCAL